MPGGRRATVLLYTGVFQVLAVEHNQYAAVACGAVQIGLEDPAVNVFALEGLYSGR